MFVTLGRANHVAFIDPESKEIKACVLVGSRAYPELKPVESQAWQCLRQTWLSNRVFKTYGAILNAGRDAGQAPPPG